MVPHDVVLGFIYSPECFQDINSCPSVVHFTEPSHGLNWDKDVAPLFLFSHHASFMLHSLNVLQVFEVLELPGVGDDQNSIGQSVHGVQARFLEAASNESANFKWTTPGWAVLIWGWRRIAFMC